MSSICVCCAIQRRCSFHKGTTASIEVVVAAVVEVLVVTVFNFDASHKNSLKVSLTYIRYRCSSGYSVQVVLYIRYIGT